jgi:UDP-GlcNAc:undecaprenyl-phosphate/decaprenyl-phosphate GlcNAc-1-phosphate transferase
MVLSIWQLFGIFLAMAIAAFLITPLFRSLANAKGVLDYPGGRKQQRKPVPYLGGLAIAFPISITSLTLLISSIDSGVKNEIYLGLILPSVIIAGVGLLDDIYELSPKVRFISQSIVGLITSPLLFINGTGVVILDNPWLNGLLTSLWVVGIINAVNFIDNMDGLATGVAIIVSIAFFVISFNNGQYLVAALSVALAGSCTGFIFWNKKPASIYLGDAGALYIGFLLAAISIRLDINQLPQIDRIIIPMLILVIPFIDTTQVVISRLSRGKSPFQGGRDHISHLLLNLGLTEKTVVTTIWVTAALFASIAIYMSKSF